jgi:peptidoglycan/xylan/chitin deacetylase (PgdA/CDA1 family)
MKDNRPIPLTVELPKGIRCAVALSYDLEMCAGYVQDGINHGHIMQPVRDYVRQLMDVAEGYNTRLHFFYVCNGLEDSNIDYLKEILNRGHVIDSHTYSHKGLTMISSEELDEELSKANRLLKEKLGVNSVVLRGPYGYKNGWRNLPNASREVIIRNGFRWVSGEYNDTVYQHDMDFWVRAADRDQPYAYSSDLIEIPFQGWTDRMWFDIRPEVDQTAIDSWQMVFGHRPVPEGWKASWTIENALDRWIELNLQTLEYTYEHELLWVPCWHPYTHYLHDPECRTLEALLRYAMSKSERAWVCTVRDAAEMLRIQK